MEDPETYDGRSGQPSDPARFVDLLDRWLSHLELDDATTVFELRRHLDQTLRGGQA